MQKPPTGSGAPAAVAAQVAPPQPKPGRRIESIGNTLKDILKDFEIRETSGRKEYLGYAFPDFPEMNRILSGLRRGNLSVLAGSRKRGRLHIMLEIVSSIIRLHKIPVLFLSYDKNPRELLYQMLSRLSGLDIETIQYKKITSDASRKEKLKIAMDKMARIQPMLYLLPGSQKDSLEIIEGIVESLKTALKVKEIILCVDSIQRVPLRGSSQPEKQKVDEITKGLKLLALAQDIAVLAGSEVSAKGMEMDEHESRDRVMFQHCRGSEELGEVVDFGMVLAKSWLDSRELAQQMSKTATHLGKDPNRLPPFEVLDLHFDCYPESEVGGFESVQFLYGAENGRFLELGRRMEQDIHRFTRLEKHLQQMVDQQDIEFYEYDPTQSPPPPAEGDGLPPIPGMPMARKPAEKVKINLKLNK